MSGPRHGYHLVDSSPWPLFVSTSMLNVTISSAASFHYFIRGFALLVVGLSIFVVIFSNWVRDVIREATFLENHELPVQFGLRLGFILFVVSEGMLFFAFFWAFFHSSLAPSIALGSLWPPIGLEIIPPFDVPLLNTIILLSSGATITLAHHAVLKNDREYANYGFYMTILLALLFTYLQVIEYFDAPFTIADGVYGSTFFLATGFHGLHVIIGTIFIIVSFYRYLKFHLVPARHFGFEAASWYWHFVDVIWLFLFLTIYIWGSA